MNQTIKLFGIAWCAITTNACGDPEQRFEIIVKDEAGAPMQGVKCFAGFYKGKNSGGAGLSPKGVSGVTNASGYIALEGQTVFFDTSVAATAPGYYDCLIDRMWITGKNGNRWEPWPVKVDIVMKKIVNPHPMFAVRPGAGMKFVFPMGDSESYGFDLIARDWVAPHGKGSVADLTMNAMVDGPPATMPFASGRMRVTFPNPGDGIIPMVTSPLGGSSLMSPQRAPDDGYLKEWSFASAPLNDGQFPGIDIGRRTWIFRVRTRADESGRIIAALYGKIQGQPEVLFFKSGPAFRITFYLNGQENEKGLEWNLEENLFSDLDRSHWPKDP